MASGAWEGAGAREGDRMHHGSAQPLSAHSPKMPSFTAQFPGLTVSYVVRRR